MRQLCDRRTSPKASRLMSCRLRGARGLSRRKALRESLQHAPDALGLARGVVPNAAGRAHRLEQTVTALPGAEHCCAPTRRANSPIRRPSAGNDPGSLHLL
jgi:hypothetical protein